MAWFACPLSDADLRRFQAVRGDSSYNTTWEALALLVACRIWLGTESNQIAVEARVRSDSLSALRSMAKMSSSAPGLNLIARELALDSVLGLYTVGVAVHIPGVANKLPDALSRMWAPEPHQFPPELAGVPETPVPPRGGRFWRTAVVRHRGGRRGKR